MNHVEASADNRTVIYVYIMVTAILGGKENENRTKRAREGSFIHALNL